jgi:hypothetical protein
MSELDRETARLETPLVVAFDQVATDEDWERVRQRALSNLMLDGASLTTLALRREMAAIIEALGRDEIACSPELATRLGAVALNGWRLGGRR